MWAGVNALLQNKFSSIIHLLSQHLLAQSHQWKHQLNVWTLLKVNNKEIRLISLLCLNVLLLTSNTSHILVFLMFLLLILNRQNPDWIVQVTISKEKEKRYISFVASRSVWFIVVRVKLRNWDTSKLDLFAKAVYRLKSVTVLIRSSILRFITWCWIWIT